MITCTFAGHREPLTAEDARAIPAALADALEALLREDGALRLYLGGMGWFDEACALAAWRAKRAHPHQRVELILVLPYERRCENADFYDEIRVPDELKALHPKAAIPARNRWLVDHSDRLIAYVRRSDGGAAATLRYAQSRNLPILQL